MTTPTPQDLLGPPLAPEVDRTPVDTTQMNLALWDVGSRISAVRRRRRRSEEKFLAITGEAERHLAAFAALYKQVSDELNAEDGMKAAIRDEATLGYAVFGTGDVDEIRIWLTLIAGTLEEQATRVRTDIVI